MKAGELREHIGQFISNQYKSDEEVPREHIEAMAVYFLQEECTVEDCTLGPFHCGEHEIGDRLSPLLW